MRGLLPARMNIYEPSAVVGTIQPMGMKLSITWRAEFQRARTAELVPRRRNDAETTPKRRRNDAETTPKSTLATMDVSRDTCAPHD